MKKTPYMRTLRGLIDTYIGWLRQTACASEFPELLSLVHEMETGWLEIRSSDEFDREPD